ERYPRRPQAGERPGAGALSAEPGADRAARRQVEGDAQPGEDRQPLLAAADGSAIRRPGPGDGADRRRGIRPESEGQEAGVEVRVQLAVVGATAAEREHADRGIEQQPGEGSDPGER